MFLPMFSFSLSLGASVTDGASLHALASLLVVRSCSLLLVLGSLVTGEIGFSAVLVKPLS